MTTFHLTVVTPDGCAFEGQAERIVCRAIDGDIAILAKHGDYCTALGGNAAVQGAELRHLGAHLGLQYAHGPVLADAVLRPAEPCHFPAAVPPR